MKKINQQEAIRQLNLGLFPKCEVSRDVKVPVRTLVELGNLERLKGVQSFILYGYNDEEIRSFIIPEGALTVDINEATDLILGNKPEDYVCILPIGKEEMKFSSPSQLSEFLDLYRKYNFNGDPFLLYWRG